MLKRIITVHWPLLLALAFTAGMGTVCLIQYRSSPFFTVPIIDEEGYVGWAEKIAAGEPPAGAFYQDPLYPYFLAAVFKVFGPGLVAARMLQLVMAVVSVGLVYAAGRGLSGPRAGTLAALGLALYAGTYFFALLILKESLTLLLAAAATALGVGLGVRPGSWRRWAGLGVILGLLALVRGNMLLVIPALLVWAAATGGPRTFWKTGALRAGVLAAGAILVLAPVTVRNYLAAGEFVLTTSQGGSNFYIGNNPAADGRYVILPFARANPRYQAEDFRAAAERRTGRAMSGSEASRFWRDEGLRWLRDHPGDALRLYLRKARLLIAQYEVPDNQSLYLVRDEFVSALKVARVGFGVLCGPAVAGMIILLRRRKPGAVFPAVFGLAYAAALLPFFIVARYRLPLLPPLCVFASSFILWVAERVRGRHWRPLLPAGLAAGALLAAGLWPMAEPRDITGYSYYLLGNAYLKSGDPARALAWLDRSREELPALDEVMAAWWGAVSGLGPEDAELVAAESRRPDRGVEELFELGRRLEELGRADDAVSAYRRAVGKEPDHVSAHERLAALLAGRPGECAEAAEHLARVAELRPDFTERAEYKKMEEVIARCLGGEKK